MNCSIQFKAIIAGALAGCVALSSAFALGRGLQHRAARESHAQPVEETWLVSNTPPAPASIARGRTLFLNSCAHCHGQDALGDEGPDLHALQVSDRYISNTVRRGIKGEMPSFAKKHNAADIAALIDYLRTLE